MKKAVSSEELQRESEKFIQKSSKLLAKIEASSSKGVLGRIMTWSRDRKTAKYLRIHDRIVPAIIQASSRYQREVDELRDTLLLRQEVSLCYIILQQLICCLVQSRMYVLEDILNAAKQIKYAMLSELLALKQKYLFNQEILHAACAVEELSRSSSQTLAVICQNECTGNDDGGKIVISRPAVWHGYRAKDGKNIAHELPIIALHQQAFGGPGRSVGGRLGCLDVSMGIWDRDKDRGCSEMSLDSSFAIDSDSDDFLQHRRVAKQFCKTVHVYISKALAAQAADRSALKTHKALLNSSKSAIVSLLWSKEITKLIECTCFEDFVKIAFEPVHDTQNEGHSLEMKEAHESVEQKIAQLIDPALMSAFKTLAHNLKTSFMSSQESYTLFSDVITHISALLQEKAASFETIQELISKKSMLEDRLKNCSSLLQNLTNIARRLRVLSGVEQAETRERTISLDGSSSNETFCSGLSSNAPGAIVAIVSPDNGREGKKLSFSKLLSLKRCQSNFV